MAKPSDYTITTFQRKPGLWRSSILRIGSSAADRMMKSALTDEDSPSEEDAALAALKMIRMMEE
jgi:hypothetical protein